MHIASEGATNISEKDAKELFKKKDERQAAEWVLDEDKLAKCASGMTAKDLAAIFVGKPRKTKKGFVRGTPLLVPTDKETLSVDVEAVKKSEEEKKMATENRSKIRTEKKAAAASAAAAAGAQTKTTTSTGSKEKHTKAATTRKKVVASEAAKPTDSNTGSVLTDGVLPGRSRTPNFFQQQLPSQKSLNAMMMLPPSPKPGANNPPAQQQGFRATSSMTPPARRRASLPKRPRFFRRRFQQRLLQLVTHARLSTGFAPRRHRRRRRRAPILQRSLQNDE